MSAPGSSVPPLHQQLVRFVIEQYRDELVASLQGTVDESRVAEEREAVASELLNILRRLEFFTSRPVSLIDMNPPFGIPIQSIATNSPSLVG